MVGERKTHRTCTLVVTHACNLQCGYCFAAFKDEQRMSFNTARKCIEQEIEYSLSAGYSELLITFMGGEPFLNFPLVKEVVDWLFPRQVHGLKIYLFATTNGTFLTPKIKEWLKIRRDFFRLSVSYDGTPQMQSDNRTALPIDLDFFLETYPVQVVHVTASRTTLGSLGQGFAYLLSRNARVSLTLAYGQKWTADDARVYEQQLRKIASLYNGPYHMFEPIPQLTVPLQMLGRDTRRINWKVGKHKVAYDVDGRRYPSYVLMPFVIGLNRALPMLENEFVWHMELQTADPFCNGCPLIGLCPTCPEFNYLYNGSFSEKDHSICGMIRAQIRVALDFQYSLHLRKAEERR